MPHNTLSWRFFIYCSNRTSMQRKLKTIQIHMPGHWHSTIDRKNHWTFYLHYISWYWIKTRLQCAKLPINIKDVMGKRTITKRTLQSIIGKLSFASAVIPARPFLRPLINLLPQVKEQHHYITLNREVKLDLAIWYTFLKQYNGSR